MQNVKAIRKYNAAPQPATQQSPANSSRATLWVVLGALIVILPLALVSLTVVAFQAFQ
jgi:flagellar basal body-associated protein FliL